MAVAYYHAATLGDVFALQSELYGLESKYNQEAVYAAMESIASAMERAVHQLLDAPHGSSFDSLVGKTKALLDLAPSVLSTKQQENRSERVKEFVLAGLPESVAEKIERLFFLGQVIENVHLSLRTGIDVEALLRLQLGVSGSASSSTASRRRAGQRSRCLPSGAVPCDSSGCAGSVAG